MKPEWREVERVVAERRVGGLGGDDGGDGQASAAVQLAWLQYLDRCSTA